MIASLDMHDTAQAIFAWSWIIGGFFVGVVIAGMTSRDEPPILAGFAGISAWFLAPMIVGLTALAGFCWLLGGGASKLADKWEARRAGKVRDREELEARIAELEAELEVHGV